jgi:predicted ATP-dependent endonuclease of OLD family
MDKNSKLTNFMVNDFDVLSCGGTYEAAAAAGIIPFIKTSSPHQAQKKHHRFFPFPLRDSAITNSIVNDLRTNFCHGKVDEEKIVQTAFRLPYGDAESFLNHLKSIKNLGTVFTKNIEKTDKNDLLIKNIRSKVLASMITNLTMYIDDYIIDSTKSIFYIEPVRAGIVRYYREQDLSVAEIDPTGKNLPMFLRNLTESERKEFKEWTLQTLGFEVKANAKHGQIALHLREEDSTQEYNLADMGFGFSQILPIVAQLWILVKKTQKSRRENIPRILSIEQPELHLHPNHQAKVADMFVAAIKLAQENKIDLRLIIETHSETIINRIGNLIYNKKLNQDDANVILFEKKHADKSADISVSGYDSDGCLTNWPYGFFQPEEG